MQPQQAVALAPILKKLVPFCFVTGAAMELFMVKTGFCSSRSDSVSLPRIALTACLACGSIAQTRSSPRTRPSAGNCATRSARRTSRRPRPCSATPSPGTNSFLLLSLSSFLMAPHNASCRRTRLASGGTLRSMHVPGERLTRRRARCGAARSRSWARGSRRAPWVG